MGERTTETRYFDWPMDHKPTFFYASTGLEEISGERMLNNN